MDGPCDRRALANWLVYKVTLYILWHIYEPSFLKVYVRSYLRIQRDQYLQQQLALEQRASEIIFHTTTVTNALSPDEYFELISRPAIEDMFMKDSFGK